MRGPRPLEPGYRSPILSRRYLLLKLQLFPINGMPVVRSMLSMFLPLRQSSTPMVCARCPFHSYISDTDCPAGGTNYRGEIVFAGEGQGDNTAPSLFVMNPVEPYNTTGKSAPLRKALVSIMLKTRSSAQQFLWSSIQFTQRCRRQSKQPGSVLHRYLVRLPSGLSSLSRSARPSLSYHSFHRGRHSRC